MFYGSLTSETCLAELGSEKGLYTIGKWSAKEDLEILNFTKYFHFSKQTGKYFYPAFPSIFDKERRSLLHDYTFIIRFATEVSRPLIKDGSESIEYVPTQVVAEYLKKIPRFNNKHLDGICFFSSIDGGINYTLFIEQEECLSSNLSYSPKQKIELLSYSEYELR